MPCKPSSATRLIQNVRSRTVPGARPAPPQIELVVPKSMSGFTGSRGLCLILLLAPQTIDGPTILAAALIPDIASADFMKRRRCTPRPAILSVLVCILLPPQLFSRKIIRWGTDEVKARADIFAAANDPMLHCGDSLPNTVH